MARSSAVPDGARKYVVHGFIRRTSNGRYLGVCLRPYLVVEGDTLGEASHKMLQLIEAYVTDAAKDGNIDEFMARRAPLSYHAQYVVAWLIHSISNSVKPFTKTCCIPQHA